MVRRPGPDVHKDLWNVLARQTTPEQVAQHFSSRAIPTRHRRGIDIQGRGGPSMTQPRSHDRHDTPAASMFVATNWRKSWKRKCGTPASSNAIRKSLTPNSVSTAPSRRSPVKRPGNPPSRCQARRSAAPFDFYAHVEVQVFLRRGPRVRVPRFPELQNRSLRPVDQAMHEPNPSTLKIHVPPQSEQLASTSARRSGQTHEQHQCRITD